jgi:hypothetical protein
VSGVRGGGWVGGCFFLDLFQALFRRQAAREREEEEEEKERWMMKE